MQQSTIGIHHQNFMLAVRHEMGWPPFRPANDCVAFFSGLRMDLAVGSEMARIAAMLRKDAIYTGWENMTATMPLGFTIVYRGLLAVDVFDRVLPYASDNDSPVVLVSSRADEHFAVDQRGSLVRIAGKPRAIGTGRKLAMKRICATAATVGDDLLAGSRFVPTGADWIEPELPVETIVRFG